MKDNIEKFALVFALILLVVAICSKLLGFTLDKVDWSPALMGAVYIAFAWIYLTIFIQIKSAKTQKKQKIAWLAFLFSVVTYSMPILDDDIMQYITYILAIILVIYSMHQLKNN